MRIILNLVIISHPAGGRAGSAAVGLCQISPRFVQKGESGTRMSGGNEPWGSLRSLHTRIHLVLRRRETQKEDTRTHKGADSGPVR